VKKDQKERLVRCPVSVPSHDPTFKRLVCQRNIVAHTYIHTKLHPKCVKVQLGKSRRIGYLLARECVTCLDTEDLSLREK
jgi:hypothetical protein